MSVTIRSDDPAAGGSFVRMRRTRVDGSTVTGVNNGERGTRLGSITSFAGDGVLALAIAVAGGASAAGASSSESGKVLLVLLAFVAALSLAVRRVYPLTVFAIVVVVTGFFGWVYGGYCRARLSGLVDRARHRMAARDLEQGRPLRRSAGAARCRVGARRQHAHATRVPPRARGSRG